MEENEIRADERRKVLLEVHQKCEDIGLHDCCYGTDYDLYQWLSGELGNDLSAM